ncbi:MAG: MBL fold metallo-hydrolase [Candidatus Heimdallarchaeota archaeon]|nr:MBL fold metallo-hydrolase [Candidatus Heimdallarchaeota archaeon]MCK4955538.1 MBL fold metallo-hydrolase [Candidatus Heimdallarchaeota archaeon]
MKTQKVGGRGFLFTFDDPYKTTMYVINGNKHIFICDTFLGPDPIADVLKYLEDNGVSGKPIIVFNSHYDYDHYWGNQCFENSMILAHELCKVKMEEEGENDLKEFESHKKGLVKLTLPSVLFRDKLVFVDDRVEFYHTPGHTEDSSSCFDHVDQVLLVGDNIESPFPYLRINNLNEYIKTLKEYLTRDAKIVISGHDDLMENFDLIKSNLEYLEKFAKGDINRIGFTKKQREIHYQNLTQIGEDLHKKGKTEAALAYYVEAAQILEELEQTSRVDELKGKISKIIKELKE